MKILIILIILAAIGYLIYRYFSKKHVSESNNYINEITLPNEKSIDENGRFYGCQRKKCANQDATRSYDLGCRDSQCYCRYYKRIVNKKIECSHYADSFMSPDAKDAISKLAEIYEKEHLFDN